MFVSNCPFMLVLGKEPTRTPLSYMDVVGDLQEQQRHLEELRLQEQQQERRQQEFKQQEEEFKQRQEPLSLQE